MDLRPLKLGATSQRTRRLYELGLAWDRARRIVGTGALPDGVRDVLYWTYTQLSNPSANLTYDLPHAAAYDAAEKHIHALVTYYLGVLASRFPNGDHRDAPLAAVQLMNLAGRAVADLTAEHWQMAVYCDVLLHDIPDDVVVAAAETLRVGGFIEDVREILITPVETYDPSAPFEVGRRQTLAR